jgi:crotonobetainyl-CoA:carnitine CoA-transferase CaiB-like acyl-CoA transferase
MESAITSASGPLTGLRVLELGSFIAAPTAGRLLADFGAEVVKVERPGTGDELRRWRLHGGDTSLLFRTLNRNKRSIAIDLREPAGRDLALSLAAAPTATVPASAASPRRSAGCARSPAIPTGRRPGPASAWPTRWPRSTR